MDYIQESKKRKLRIAIDFDDTFTADPKLWSSFINLLKLRDHECYIITLRNETDANISEVNSVLIENGIIDIPIIFCNGTWKDFIAKSKGINIDIWIDDMPFVIADPNKIECPWTFSGGNWKGLLDLNEQVQK